MDQLGGFTEFLGLTFQRTDADGVTATWQAGPHLHQPYGIVHGGAHSGVVETLASVAAAYWLGDEGKVVGVSNTTDFFRPCRDELLTSRATPVHRGRTQQVWVVETHDEQGRLVARGEVRLQNLRDEDGSARA
jgi:uncharacterized protein (TIGR00369 family)